MRYISSHLLICLFFLSCTGQGPVPYGQQPYGQQPYGQQPYGQQPYGPQTFASRSDQDYDRRKLDDRDRSAVLNNSRQRNSGDICEDYSADHQCKDDCRSIYKRGPDRDDCEELTTKQIEKLVDVHEILKEANDDDLEDIELEDLEVYLNVSIAAFDYVVGKYSRGEAKDALIWIVENEDVTKLLKKEDDDYETLEEILESLSGSFDDDELHVPFTRSVDGRNTLMDMAIDSDNEEAVEWFQEFLFEKEPKCDSRDRNDQKVCFTIFCKIGEEMDRNSREEWLNYGEFEDLVDEVIQEGIGGASSPSDGEWNTDDIEDVDNIPNDDFLNLCGNLLS